ncbi:MAG: hypothetical protein ABW003_25080 [Microvirga sp.]
MTKDRERDFFDRVQPELTAFEISLQEEDGVTVDQVGDARCRRHQRRRHRTRADGAR